ncbi:hypothetical protein B0H19DRAFT_1156092 [Mycena capillaripes]|nr:hypothetical protein B0H19DRAFT_1156092 [Mycena capillaripes]
MPSVLFLSELDADIIFSIFAFCDISSVVSTSQTCRYLHGLAFHKSVWLQLLDNLRRKSILDRNCSPNIETLSTSELIKLVKRLTTGPATWNPLNAASIPQISKEITIRTGPGILDWEENNIKLLPSGRYILFHNGNQLECWNVANDRLTWKHVSALEHGKVVEFGAEENEGEDSIIVIRVGTFPPNGDRKNYLEVVGVNLETGTYNTLLAVRAPDSDYDSPFSMPLIRGALVAVGINTQLDKYMFVDWREQCYFILQCPGMPPSRIALVERHIVLQTTLLDGAEIHIIANDTLRNYWTPITTIDAHSEFTLVRAADIPKHSTFVVTEVYQSFDHISVVDSPLQDDHYRVWIYGTIYSSGTSGILGYQLSIPRTGPPQWRTRVHASEVAPSLHHTVPYSGHTFHQFFRSGYHIFPPTSSCKNLRVKLPPSVIYVDVAPYSGALTYATGTSIVIQYYK